MWYWWGRWYIDCLASVSKNTVWRLCCVTVCVQLCRVTAVPSDDCAVWLCLVTTVLCDGHAEWQLCRVIAVLCDCCAVWQPCWVTVLCDCLCDSCAVWQPCWVTAVLRQGYAPCLRLWHGEWVYPPVKSVWISRTHAFHGFHLWYVLL